MFKVTQGNIWDNFQNDHNPDKRLIVTTNGFVKRNMENVMGRGIALQARKRYPKLALELGERLHLDGNMMYDFPEYNIITFPVKKHWMDKTDLWLVKQSCIELNLFIHGKLKQEKNPIVYMTKVGCGNGMAKWSEVKLILEEKLFDVEEYIKIIDMN